MVDTNKIVIISSRMVSLACYNKIAFASQLTRQTAFMQNDILLQILLNC